MAKEITYQFLDAEINHGTDEEPDIEQIISDRIVICPTETAFIKMYPLVEKDAIPGSINVDGEFDPETEVEPTTDDILTALLGV